ncbi:MAG: sigma-70 family RNA polymerase sigma factor [Microcystaceae cyanobacterium]
MTIVLTDNPAKLSNLELVMQCQKGNSTLFRQLYQRYQDRVRATLFQLCGGNHLEDLVQEVFLRVWKSLPKLREASYFSTWLYRITWNVATDERRKYARQPKMVEDESQLHQAPSVTTQTPDLMRLHYQELIQQGLQKLNLEHRAVMVLHDLEDIPQKEVADILQLPLGTVKSRLFYARKQLKQYLQDQGVVL